MLICIGGLLLLLDNAAFYKAWRKVIVLVTSNQQSSELAYMMKFTDHFKSLYQPRADLHCGEYTEKLIEYTSAIALHLSHLLIF